MTVGVIVDAGFVLHQGIYARLAATDEIKDLLGDPPRLYDAVPEDTVFPYLTLGEARRRAVDGAPGAEEHDLRLHAWSRYYGRREAREILAAVHAALQDAALDLGPDYRLVSLRYRFGDIFEQPDNQTFHSAMRFRAVTERAA